MSLNRRNSAVPWLHVHRFALHTAALLVASSVVGCGDDVPVEGPAILVIQDRVQFNAVPVGQFEVQWIEVSNDGRSDLQIWSVDITGPQGAFEVRGADELVVAPGESALLQFVYNATTVERVLGTAFFNSNGGDIEVDLQTSETEGLLDVSPNPVLFGRVAANTCKLVDVTLVNRGTADVVVERVVPIDPSGEFFLPPESEPLLPITLTPAGTETNTAIVQVSYCPTDDNRDESSLVVISETGNDRSEANIPMEANGAAPCISVTHEDGFSFGPSLLGQTRSELFTLTNCSAGDTGKILAVESLAFSEPFNDNFALADMPVFPLELDPQQSTTFVVAYTPDELGASDRTIVRIVSNDEVKTPLDIEITGLGSDNECPVPVATCTIVGSELPPDVFVVAYPGDVIACTAAGSSDDTAIADYAWTVTLDWPELAVPVEGSGEPEMTFVAGNWGTHTVELDVVDDRGMPACTVAEALVGVDHSWWLYVELEWAPADSEGSGAIADVQLHLLDEGGCWGEAPLDCWSGNPEPAWGDPGRSHDDPSFSGDGPGAEGRQSIDMLRTAPGTQRIGVHYNAAEGAAPIVVRIKVFFFGDLVLQRTRELSADARFWDVASTSWPSAFITFTNAVYPTLEEAPCP